MASYTEDKKSHSTIDLLLWQSVCIVFMTKTFILRDVWGGDR